MKRRHSMFPTLTLAVFLGLAACEAPPPADEASETEGETEAVDATPASTYPAPSPEVPADANVVDIVAEDYAIESPDTILSGWTTFRMQNDGEETHFVLVTRLPEDRTYDDYAEGVVAAVNDIWYRMRDEGLGKGAALEELGAAIPAWYWTGTEVHSGPGMVVPTGVSQVTLELEPGTYVLECFMKTAEGEFHHAEGMLRPLEVIEERSDAMQPDADVRLTLTTEAITSEGEVAAGTNTFALTFQEQPEVGFGNDVHVVRLEEGMTPESLVSWMDAFNIEGLQNPAPAPFVGGAHERPAGNTVYFSVELLPGRYAWFSEGTDATGGIYEEFTVE